MRYWKLPAFLLRNLRAAARPGVLAGLLTVALALALSSGASAQHAERAIDEKTANALASGTALLKPGDVVRLRIWREPDLSGDFPVDEAGVVVFPRLGPFRVTSHSPNELKDRLVDAYRIYLRNPSIDVVFLRRVNILGAVRDPGLYTVDPTTTLADALALAGGTRIDGDANRIQLIREGEVLTGRLSHRSIIADLPIRSGDQLYVPERSWLSRNTGLVATGISAGVSLFIAVFLR